MAVAAGFEPAVGGYPTNAFEAFTFGRSDTPPPIRIEQTAGCVQIRGGLAVGLPGRLAGCRFDGRGVGRGARVSWNLGAFLQIVVGLGPVWGHYL